MSIEKLQAQSTAILQAINRLWALPELCTKVFTHGKNTLTESGYTVCTEITPSKLLHLWWIQTQLPRLPKRASATRTNLRTVSRMQMGHMHTWGETQILLTTMTPVRMQGGISHAATTANKHEPKTAIQQVCLVTMEATTTSMAMEDHCTATKGTVTTVGRNTTMEVHCTATVQP